VNQIKKGFSEIGPTYKPNLAYILVNKQCSTKFFTDQDLKGGGRGGKGRTVPELSNP